MNDLSPSELLAAADFDESDIRRCLPGEIEKGRSYQLRGAVADFRVTDDGRRITAAVEGTASRPYQVIVDLQRNRRRMFVARCSCPVAWNCKHAAAVLLYALDQAGAEPAAPPPKVLAAPLAAWVAQLRGAAAGPEKAMLVYRLDRPRKAADGFVIELRVVRQLKSGRYSEGRHLPLNDLDLPTTEGVSSEDRLIGRLLRNGYGNVAGLPQDAKSANLLIERVVATGRCCWQDVRGPCLALGPARRGTLAWRLDKEGNQIVAASVAEPSTEMLPCAAPWYIDTRQNLVGQLDFGIEAATAVAFLRAPPVAPDAAALVAAALAEKFRGSSIPLPQTDVVEEVCDEPPVPVLRLVTRSRRDTYYYSRRPADDRTDLALLGFEYDGGIINAASAPHEIRQVKDGRVMVRRRDIAAEFARRARLAEFSLDKADDFVPQKGDRKLSAFGFDAPEQWAGFLHATVPLLEAEGWRIERDESFRPESDRRQRRVDRRGYRAGCLVVFARSRH